MTYINEGEDEATGWMCVYSIEGDPDNVMFDSEPAAKRWAEILDTPTARIIYRNVLSMRDLNGG
jgi:hypothetical protein